jgi:hypothetical protein
VRQLQERGVKLYSARHCQTDEAPYTNSTKATGIKVNRVDANEAGILARLKAEGATWFGFSTPRPCGGAWQDKGQSIPAPEK